MTASVLVLNAGYERLHIVSVQHAVRMLVRGVAVVEEAEKDRNIGHLPYPKVLRLVKYVAMKWAHGRVVGWTRHRLLARDQNLCGYCKKKATTVDHILPVSRGGRSTWLNTVAACKPCNGKKNNRTPEEAHMKLLVTPFQPTWWQVTMVE
jgi:5-methylcytosine-specific restriction endonuclease McrA